MPFLVPGRMPVQLPAGGAPGARRLAEYVLETPRGAFHLALGPAGVAPHHKILPAHMVPAVHADLEAAAAHRAHDIRAAAADIGPGQQRAVKQRAHTVMLEHRGAAYFRKEPRPEDAAHGAAGMVGSEAEEKGAAGAMLLQQLGEPRYALLRTAIGIDVDL